MSLEDGRLSAARRDVLNHLTRVQGIEIKLALGAFRMVSRARRSSSAGDERVHRKLLADLIACSVRLSTKWIAHIPAAGPAIAPPRRRVSRMEPLVREAPRRIGRVDPTSGDREP